MDLGLSARSALPGLRFPALPASDVLPRFALFQQLEASQWLDPDKLEQWQFLQLDILVRHAWASVPGYRSRLEAAGLVPGSPLLPQAWSRLPLLTRRDLQLHGSDFVSRAMPPEHGTTNPARTSGSSGEPVEVLRSGLDRLMWEATTPGIAAILPGSIVRFEPSGLTYPRTRRPIIGVPRPWACSIPAQVSRSPSMQTCRHRRSGSCAMIPTIC